MNWFGHNPPPRARVEMLVKLAAAGALGATALAATPASALTINPVFDTSITSRADAAQIMSAFNTAASYYSSALTNSATINIGVSWGSVKGQTMGAGALGSSMDNLYGYFTFAQMQSYLSTIAANSPTNTALITALKALKAPSTANQYVIPSAQAKALGLISATQSSKDGYIGFSNTALFDYNAADGITANAYDFAAVAAHEIDEVLGRISGLSSTAPTYRTTMDLFRYSAPGVMSYSYNSPAYFSIDGGVTRMGDFNYTGGGDRGDWLTSTWGYDIQAAYLTAGRRMNLSAADLTILDVMGYGGNNPGSTQLWTPTFTAKQFMGTGVPEPMTWSLMIAGFGLAGVSLRARRRAAVQAA